MTKQRIDEFVEQLKLVHSDCNQCIIALGWWLHESEQVQTFSAPELKRLYAKLHFSPPSNFHPYLKRLVERDTPLLIKSKAGYRLSAIARKLISSRLGERQYSVHASELLSDLLSQVSSKEEKVFLEETIRCLDAKAYRATIVMAWNLAYDHLCRWLVSQQMDAINDALPTAFPKHRIKVISSKSDIMEFRESDLLQLCRTARVLDKDIIKILKEKLDRRNSAAHPSNVTIGAIQAEDTIIDLVENCLLKLTT